MSAFPSKTNTHFTLPPHVPPSFLIFSYTFKITQLWELGTAKLQSFNCTPAFAFYFFLPLSLLLSFLSLAGVEGAPQPNPTQSAVNKTLISHTLQGVGSEGQAAGGEGRRWLHWGQTACRPACLQPWLALHLHPALDGRMERSTSSGGGGGRQASEYRWADG